MTNKYAIKVLTELRGYGDKFANIGFDRKEALDMAIKALEIQACKPNGDDWEGYADRLYELAYQHGQEGKEPCEDCVSRKEVINIYMDTVHTRKLTQMLVRFKKLSSVQPTRPNGKWKRIHPQGIYECSECGINLMTEDIECYEYCHGCGAKMAESENNE